MARVGDAVGVEHDSVPKVFSRRTLGEFEDASASIPFRRLDPAFEGAGIRLDKGPGGSEESRRTRFRRYVASVDQRDPQQLGRLGKALGTLIDAVAASKEEFLIKAAERDGFLFAGGIFKPAGTARGSFAITRVEELASVDDRGRRLLLLANDNPQDAIGGAHELVESVCRTVCAVRGGTKLGISDDLARGVALTLAALEFVPADGDAVNEGRADLMRQYLQQLGAVVARLDELGNVDLSPRHARLAVGVAVTFARFVAETWADRAAHPEGATHSVRA